MFKRLLTTLLATSVSTLALTSHATTVQFQTSLGEIEVVLFDEKAPATVANFLDYVNSDTYEDTIIHRSKPDFVVQGGGYRISEDAKQLIAVPKSDSVVNEPHYSNVYGTIAMAKIGNLPDSATSQWFFNVKNNSGSLDYLNGGFTVFGQVSSESMAVVNAINGVPTFNIPPLEDLPLQDRAESADSPLTQDNFIFLYNVEIIDADPNSADALESLPPQIPPQPSSNSNSGGAMGLSTLLILLSGLVFRITVSRCARSSGAH